MVKCMAQMSVCCSAQTGRSGEGIQGRCQESQDQPGRLSCGGHHRANWYPNTSAQQLPEQCPLLSLLLSPMQQWGAMGWALCFPETPVQCQLRQRPPVELPSASMGTGQQSQPLFQVRWPWNMAVLWHGRLHSSWINWHSHFRRRFQIRKDEIYGLVVGSL